jgi:tellurite resistance protein
MAQEDNNQTENSSKYTIDEAVIYSSLYVVCIDGEMDDDEVNIVRKHAFLGGYHTMELEEKFITLLKNEHDFISMIKNDFKETYNDVDHSFKKDFINAITKIIIADGEVDKNESLALSLISTSLGLSGDEVTNIIKEETQRMKSQHHSSNLGCGIVSSLKWYDTNWIWFWLIVFWPIFVYGLVKRYKIIS